MTRPWFVLGCILTAAAPVTAQDRFDEQAAAVRRLSGQYAAAVLKKDAAALGRLLSDGYSQIAFGLPEDRKGVIGYYINPRRTFASFITAGVRVRVDGDTAIESGAVHASGMEYGGNFDWGGIRYSRVWLKRDGVWRVAHEHRG